MVVVRTVSIVLDGDRTVFALLKDTTLYLRTKSHKLKASTFTMAVALSRTLLLPVPYNCGRRNTDTIAIFHLRRPRPRDVQEPMGPLEPGHLSCEPLATVGGRSVSNQPLY